MEFVCFNGICLRRQIGEISEVTTQARKSIYERLQTGETLTFSQDKEVGNMH